MQHINSNLALPLMVNPRLFVYGSLKKGMSAFELYLSNARFIGGCSIPGVLLNLGRYPGLRPDEICRVTGEVYEVSWPDITEHLDVYEGHPHLFARKQISTPLGMAWVYEFNQRIKITDETLCVKEGVWLGGMTDRASYKDVLAFFMKRDGKTPFHPHTTPPEEKKIISLPAIIAARREEAAKAATQSETRIIAPAQVEVVVVGPGIEML